MAVFIRANGISASRLLEMIKNGIKGKTIQTWAYDPATGFTHVTKSGTWNKGAYLSVRISEDDKQKLSLFYKPGTATVLPTNTYGVLNGRFSEMILNHFAGHVKKITLQDRRHKH